LVYFAKNHFVDLKMTIFAISDKIVFV
jgi:hypothetical protein